MTPITPAPAVAVAAKAPAPGSVAAAKAPAGTPAMRATAQAFEAVLIGQMTKLMIESSGDGGEFSGGHGESMFRGVMAEQLGTEIARRGGLGLAPAVLQQIIMLQNGDSS